jgi:hypothetical protein
MKKLLLLIALPLFTFQISRAQTQKGSQTLGFNLGFTSSTSNETDFDSYDSTSSVAKTKTTNFSIGPNYSYFIADNLDLGASLQYMSNVENDYPVDGQFGEKEITHNFGASVFLRKYFMYANKIGIRTGPYLAYERDAEKDVSTGSTADPANDLSTKTNNYDAGINLDFVYFPSKKLGFSATLANLEYNYYKRNDVPTKDHETGDNLSFNIVNNGLLLSVFFVFGSK